MDIYNYLNSRDVADYCRKIGYQFDAVESAFIIAGCLQISVQEKQELLRELMQTTADVIFEKKSRRYREFHEIGMDSLYAVLEKYLAIEAKVLENLLDTSANAVYTYTKIAPDGGKVYASQIYSSYKKTYAAIMDELEQYTEPDEEPLCRIQKQWLDTDRYITAHLLPNGKPMQLSTNTLNDTESDIFDLFDLLWVKIPTPFQKGDLLYGANPWTLSNLNIMREPMVLTGICYDLYDEETIRKKQLSADSSDMTAYGYWVNSDGSICEECMHSYHNLEYYRGTLAGDQRILKAISSHMKGEIPMGMLIAAYDAIRAERAVKNAVPRWDYIEEYYEKAGIADVRKKRNMMLHFDEEECI